MNLVTIVYNIYKDAFVEESRDLIHKFFISFSKAEFALKENGFINNNNATPNWDTFANSITDIYNWEGSNELKIAHNYLLNNPPKKQVVSNGELIWETVNQDANRPRILKLKDAVKNTRNNLFHGGKFQGVMEPEVSRNSILINSSLIVLNEFMRCNENVKNSFTKAIEH